MRSGQPIYHRTQGSNFNAPVVIVCLGMTLGMALGDGLSGPALAQVSETENRITAGFVYNFCRFAEWPASLGDTLRLTVLSADEQTDALEAIAGKEIRQSVMDVTISPDLDTGINMQALFISRSQKKPIKQVLDQVVGYPVLTISNTKGFCEQGGMIEVIKIKGKMKFIINLTAIRKAGLGMSSRPLKLAVRVIQDG